MFSIGYQKQPSSGKLFKTLGKNLGISQIQNYNPIYSKFFTLNETNCNNIGLNHRNRVMDVVIDDPPKGGGKKSASSLNIKERNFENLNERDCTRIIHIGPVATKTAFIKFSPLLEYFDYFVGKLTPEQIKAMKFPTIGDDTDPNGAAFVDAFFVYLSSQLLHVHGFKGGLDYYGSYLAMKQNYRINIIDELEVFMKSPYFNAHKNTAVFKVDDYSHLVFDAFEPVKQKIEIGEDNEDLLVDVETIEAADVPNSDAVESVPLSVPLELCEVETNEHTDDNASIVSDCSSRSSHTTEILNEELTNSEKDFELRAVRNPSSAAAQRASATESDIETDDENPPELCECADDDTETSYTDTYDSSDADEVLYATIPQFPVQVTFMEKCEGTFGDVFSKLSDEEIVAAFMQIIMNLLVYKRAFGLTHNDLHIDNVMWVYTDEEFLWYKFQDITYRIPTYGKIFKIIDFGRAIYQFKGKRMCSDHFKFRGEAYGQYNTEPYFDETKPRIDPNPSFDLCRFGCSLIDDMDPKEPLYKLVHEWCLDDRGTNIIYKKTGEERYEGFKLYKMIARGVHAHTPEAQLLREEFRVFEVAGIPNVPKKGAKKIEVFDIDALPCYM